MLIRPDVIWKKISRPLYNVHFTVIHTNSRHNNQDSMVIEDGMVLIWYQDINNYCDGAGLSQVLFTNMV